MSVAVVSERRSTSTASRGRRVLPVLQGLAILAVVANHASTEVLRYVEADGRSSGNLVLLAIKEYPLFSVPAFLFLSGYFAAYAARGDPPRISWRVTKGRVLGLLWPYLLWCALVYAGQVASGTSYTVPDLVRRVTLGHLAAPYYFVPLLCQLYVLAPILVPYARRRPGMLLCACLSLQAAAVVLFYIRVYRVPWPSELGFLLNGSPTPFVRGVFYFFFGVVLRFHQKAIRDRLAPYRRPLAACVIFFGACSVAECELGAERMSSLLDARDMVKLSSTLFSIAALLFFATLERVRLPLATWVEATGTQSYGIYLAHYGVIVPLAGWLAAGIPWIVSQPHLFVVLLFGSGLALPLALMALVARSPARPYYRLAFG